MRSYVCPTGEGARSTDPVVMMVIERKSEHLLERKIRWVVAHELTERSNNLETIPKRWKAMMDGCVFIAEKKTTCISTPCWCLVWFSREHFT